MTKRSIFCFLFVLCLAASTVAAAEIWHVQTPNGKPLNVRSEASKIGGIIATIDNGSAVEVVKLLKEGEWAQISLNNRTGYCMTSYLFRDSGELGYTLVYDRDLFTLERSDGIDTYRWNDQTEGMPNCYLSVSRLTGYTLEEAINGLALQSGVDGERSAIALDGQEALSYSFCEGSQEHDRVVQYVCVPQSDGSILLIELACYAVIQEAVEPYLREMLFSITLSGQSDNPDSSSGAAETEYVRCCSAPAWKLLSHRGAICRKPSSGDSPEDGFTAIARPCRLKG